MYEEIFKKYDPAKDNLIFILHEIQDTHPQHYISSEAVEKVSEFLKIPKSHVYGVVTFYSMFSTKPRGKNIIRLCESPPCFLRGSENVLNKLKEILDVEVNETTADGKFTLELCACLGVCGNAPVMMINEELFGDLNDKRVEKIIANIKGGEK